MNDLVELQLPYVTLLYASVAGFMLVGLSTLVILGRRRGSISLGTGGSQDMEQKTRVQGNFTEYVPLGLVLLGLVEMTGGDPLFVRIAGGCLILARLMHMQGLLSNPGGSIGRVAGTALTLIYLLAVSGYAMVLAFLA